MIRTLGTGRGGGGLALSRATAAQVNPGFGVMQTAAPLSPAASHHSLSHTPPSWNLHLLCYDTGYHVLSPTTTAAILDSTDCPSNTTRAAVHLNGRC